MTPPEQMSIVNGEVADSHGRAHGPLAHRYALAVGGREVRIIAILDGSDTVRAALDACAICGSQGYYQDGKHVTVRNCAAAVYVPTIGLAGGCNPIHVDYRVEGDSIRIAAPSLDAAARYFR